MSHTLTNYNGVQIVTPEDDLSADRQVLNGNFEFLADHAFVAGATVSDTNGDSLTVCNGTEAIAAVGPTSLDNGAIATDGNGNLIVRFGSLVLNAGVLPGDHFDGTALDFSGNGFNGTWDGTAAYAAGAIAGHMAASLNGASSYINMGLVAAIQNLVDGEFTVSAWVNLASFPQPYNFIAVTGLGDGYGFALIVHSDGHLSLTKCGVIDQSLAYPFATGTWYFLTAAQHFSGGSPSYAELFVNDSSIGTFSDTTNYRSASGQDFLVGQSRTNYTHGLIQEVKLYAYAMPSAEISYFWNSGAGRYGVPGSGLLFPSQVPTTAAPAYVKGGIYFDTTLNKLRIGGASGWETVTSS